MGLRFQVRRKDAAARIARLEVDGKRLETPALMPVFNPKKPLISVEELADIYKAPALMANAYTLLKNPELKDKAVSEGIHKLLGYDGVIATDSGSYQLMAYGAIDTTNRDILGFEEGIGSDIGSFLDIPTLPDAYKPRAKEQLEKTLERAAEAKDAEFTVNAAIQGGRYVDLRSYAAKEIGKDFQLTAIGGIVPLMESYRFAELTEVILACRQNMPLDRVVHAFGLGHPMVFPLAVFLGCDLFDSAAYALYAQDGRYMTYYGTEHVDNLEHVSCTCPVCIEHGANIRRLYGQDRVKALARHNLYVSYAMIEKVKQAIVDGRLWELVCIQSRSHPQLMKALQALTRQVEWFSELDPITKKKSFYMTGRESTDAPITFNAKSRMRRISTDNTIELAPFGKVNEELIDIYPFNGVYSMLDEVKPKMRDMAKLQAIMEYQFGFGAGELLPENLIVKKSKNTKRIRWLYEGKQLFAAVRANDHFILPHMKLALKLKQKYKPPKLRVTMQDDEEVLQYVRDGKSVMCKFVEDVDPELRAGDECLIVDKKDNLIGSGTLMLSPKEIKDFTYGMAVRPR